MCRGRHARDGRVLESSQRGVQRLVDVGPPSSGVDVCQPPPSAQQGRGAKRTPRQGPEFGDRVPIASHRKRFPSFDAIKHAATVIAQFSDRHFGHVSPYHR